MNERAFMVVLAHPRTAMQTTGDVVLLVPWLHYTLGAAESVCDNLFVCVVPALRCGD